MRIGVISDIHADLVALVKAVTFLREQEVEQIVCAGDLVEKGPDGDVVVKFLQVENILCAQGNHDYDVIGNQAWLRRHADQGNLKVRVRLLTDATLEYLRTLPRTIQFEDNGKRIVVAHGTPWHSGQYVFHNSPPGIFRYLIKETGADIMILGHTHTPMIIHVGSAMVVNPGSVCGSHAYGSGTCAILDDHGFHVYDIHSGARIAPTEESVPVG
jgi:putative phosphoesterase